MDILIKELSEELERLSMAFMLTDKLSQKNSGGFEKKYLVFSKKQIRIRIDANRNHALPHLHVDYGNEFHAVSINISTGEVLAGTLPNKYLKDISKWISHNQRTLLSIWEALRNHEDPSKMKLELTK